MSETSPSAASTVRDLELIALGYALCKEGREAVFAGLPEQVMSTELVAAFRSLNGGPSRGLIGWLSERGVKVGNSPIDDILYTIRTRRAQLTIRHLLERAKFATGPLTDSTAREYLAGILREALAMLHEVGDSAE